MDNFAFKTLYKESQVKLSLTCFFKVKNQVYCFAAQQKNSKNSLHTLSDN